MYKHSTIWRITDNSQQRSPGHQLGITLIDVFPPKYDDGSREGVLMIRVITDTKKGMCKFPWFEHHAVDL